VPDRTDRGGGRDASVAGRTSDCWGDSRYPPKVRSAKSSQYVGRSSVVAAGETLVTHKLD
jgi:hypothetical protein